MFEGVQQGPVLVGTFFIARQIVGALVALVGSNRRY